jgi:hypothetical protein
MTKRPLSPEEKLMHSYIAGKGLYSAVQLKNYLTSSPPKEEEDKFIIKIPKERLQHAKKADFQGTLMPFVSAIKGFKEKEDEHIKFHKNHLQKQLDQAQDEYLKALMSEKKASIEKESTPHVDALCMGMLTVLEKKAENETISDGSLLRSLGNIGHSALHPVTKHLPTSDDVVNKGLNFVGKGVEKTLPVSVLAMYLLRKNQEKKELPSESPLNVQIQAI